MDNIYTFLIGKLVRDKTQKNYSLVSSDPDIEEYIYLDDISYKKCLLLKLIEEAKELYRELNKDNTYNKNKFTEEYIDVLTVMNYIKESFNLKEEDIESTYKTKSKLRGEFRDKLYLKHTIVVNNKENKYCLPDYIKKYKLISIE